MSGFGGFEEARPVQRDAPATDLREGRLKLRQFCLFVASEGEWKLCGPRLTSGSSHSVEILCGKSIEETVSECLLNLEADLYSLQVGVEVC